MTTSAGLYQHPPPTVPRDERVALLSAVGALGLLPLPALHDLAASLHEESFASGTVIVESGAVGDRMFLVVSGTAEVTAPGDHAPVLLATLQRGEYFGEIALLDGSHLRTAAVTAVTDLHTLVLPGVTFQDVLRRYPEAAQVFQSAAETSLRLGFLKRSSPFQAIAPEHLRALAGRLEPVQAAAGETIIRQGESGDSCYLVRSGKVQVVLRRDDGSERTLATLEPGMLFGETALLTDAPRSATVRAVDAVELLVLRRTDALATIDENQQIGLEMIDLLQMRLRPRRRADVLVQERATDDGEIITILKDPTRGAYFQLSPQGRFIWQRLDGQHTLRDLSLDYLMAFKSLAMPAIIGVVQGLTAAGFLEGPAVRADVAAATYHVPRWQRMLDPARRLVDWQISIPHVDAIVTFLYNRGLHLLYTWPGQVMLALVAVLGLLPFFATAGRATEALQGPAGGALLALLIPGVYLTIILHEIGHGMTTKHFGREVPRAGVGWYWFGPIAYVDTSAMWSAARWQRIAVSIAGPYTFVLAAGVAATASWLSDGALMALLWQIALSAYLLALLNLNPLLEYDGYYVLMDLLERPNLRRQTLGWLGANLLPALRDPGRLRGHWFELVYGVGAIVWVVIMAGVTVLVYRLLAEGWMSSVLPTQIAGGIAWALAGLVTLLTLSSLASDLHGGQAAQTGRS